MVTGMFVAVTNDKPCISPWQYITILFASVYYRTFIRTAPDTVGSLLAKVQLLIRFSRKNTVISKRKNTCYLIILLRPPHSCSLTG